MPLFNGMTGEDHSAGVSHDLSAGPIYDTMTRVYWSFLLIFFNVSPLFPVAAARVWNLLPPSVRCAPSLSFAENSRLFCLGRMTISMRVLTNVLAVV